MQTKSPDIIGAFQLLVRYLTNNFTAINRYKFYIGLFLGCWMIGFWILDLLVSLTDQGFRAFLWIFGFNFGFVKDFRSTGFSLGLWILVFLWI
jgi:hypothetical protein